MQNEQAPQQLSKDSKEGEPPYKLHLAMLGGINLDDFPPGRTHYLVYALQFGLPIPTQATIHRCDRKNRKKLLKAHKQNDGDNDYNYRRALIWQRHRIFHNRNFFRLPKKYGNQPEKAELPEWGVTEGRRKRRFGGKVFRSAKALPYRRKRVPPRNPICLPIQIKPKKPIIVETQIQEVQKKPCVSVRSPSWCFLKSERDRFIRLIEKYRQQKKPDHFIDSQERVKEKPKVVPEYFRKKKANQHRRRQEKHELIQANRRRLIEIFGDAVLKSGWPVSRKEIKLALGIKEEEHDKVFSLAQFMAQFIKNSDSQTKDDRLTTADNDRNWLSPGPKEISRRMRLVSQTAKTKELESQQPTSYTCQPNPDNKQEPQFMAKEEQFPSLDELGSSCKKSKMKKR